LKYVFIDISNPVLVAGCRSLGIISKLVTAPLWREAKTQILEMNEKLTALRDFFREARNDASNVLEGNMSPFPDNVDKGDIVLRELLKSDETDKLTIQILQSLFSSMLTLLERQACDHLPGGRYCSKDESIYKEATSVLKHNKLPEFFFGQLDFLLRYRPNASSLCNEAYLIYSHNKTKEWLDSLDDRTKEQYLNDSRREGILIRQKFQERLKAIEGKRIEAMKLKEKELAEKKQRLVKKKEGLTNDILFFGLWQSKEDTTFHLDQIPTKQEKLKALKAQLNFRKSVLLQKPSDKSLFLFSSKKKAKTVPELTKQVLELIEESKLGDVGKCTSEGDMPVLIGKNISHKFENGVYVGRVISIVPGFPNWYNVKYKNDPAIYVYQLYEDYRSGNMEIIVEGYTSELTVQFTVDLSSTKSRNDLLLLFSFWLVLTCFVDINIDIPFSYSLILP
jgi:hypothetical protein